MFFLKNIYEDEILKLKKKWIKLNKVLENHNKGFPYLVIIHNSERKREREKGDREREKKKRK